VNPGFANGGQDRARGSKGREEGDFGPQNDNFWCILGAIFCS